MPSCDFKQCGGCCQTETSGSKEYSPHQQLAQSLLTGVRLGRSKASADLGIPPVRWLVLGCRWLILGWRWLILGRRWRLRCGLHPLFHSLPLPQGGSRSRWWCGCWCRYYFSFGWLGGKRGWWWSYPPWHWTGFVGWRGRFAEPGFVIWRHTPAGTNMDVSGAFVGGGWNVGNWIYKIACLILAEPVHRRGRQTIHLSTNIWGSGRSVSLTRRSSMVWRSGAEASLLIQRISLGSKVLSLPPHIPRPSLHTLWLLCLRCRVHCR